MEDLLGASADLCPSLWTFHPLTRDGEQAAPRRSSRRNQQIGRAEPRRAVYQMENVGRWGRYAGLGRGLTAPSRAASYHGPMPTLSTCPSWNKDGRRGGREGFTEEHPRGYSRGVPKGYAYTPGERVRAETGALV